MSAANRFLDLIPVERLPAAGQCGGGFDQSEPARFSLALPQSAMERAGR